MKKWIKRVYVAGNYSRNAFGERATILEVLDNIRAGQKASLDILRMGFAVHCPWLDYQYALLDDSPISDKVYKKNSMLWLEVSDCVVVISGAGLKTGVDAEISRASSLSLPIYYGVRNFYLNQKED